MSECIQKVNLVAEVFEPTEVEVKFTKKGESKPSKIFHGFSGFPKIEDIPTYSSTNYIPGKITFNQKEEK